MDVTVGEKGGFCFGPFVLDPLRRRLARNGVPVKLTPTRFDTLHYLVANAGRVVEKDELLAAVWGGRIVEEANLTQTISFLRRTLQEAETGAENYIVTAPGRGYRFAETVRREEPFQHPAPVRDGSAGAPHVAVPGPVPPRRPALRGSARALIALGAACAVAAVAAFSAWLLLRAPAPRASPPPHSVAVLAFTNLGGGTGQDYFADGISGELINMLGHISGVTVAGRLSAFSFKGRNVTVPEIAHALNVGAVLDGSVQRDGARLRIEAHLVDGMTGYQIWGQTYERTLSDTLALQTDIASGVASALEVKLLGAETMRLTVGKTSNPSAFDAYLRATGLVRFYTRASQQAALAAYDEAIRNDPAFAAAYAGRSIVQSRIAVTWKQDEGTRQAALRQALAEADHAVALAPDSGEARAARAIALQHLLDFRGAEDEIRRAHELEPGNLEVERLYSRIEIGVGHTESALAAAKHLVALDPLTSGAYFWLAATQIYGRHFDEGLATLRTESALGAADPGRSASLMAAAHLGEGNPAAAVRDCEPLRTEYPNCNYSLAIAYERLGQTELAQRVFARQIAEDGEKSMFPVEVYAGWGDLRNAVRVLNARFQARDPDLSDLRANPLLDPVRATPEYRAIETELDYPP